MDVDGFACIVIATTILVRTDVNGHFTSIVGIILEVGAIVYCIREAHITHEATTEDVITVNRFDIDISSSHRGIEATTEHTTKECLTSDSNICSSPYYAWISSTDDIHHCLTWVEMRMKLCFIMYLICIPNFNLSLSKLDIEICIIINHSILTIAATKYAEVWWAYLMIYFLPLLGSEEATFILIFDTR